eukprot:41758-Prymnesium_polylepis.1
MGAGPRGAFWPRMRTRGMQRSSQLLAPRVAALVAAPRLLVALLAALPATTAAAPALLLALLAPALPALPAQTLLA